VTSGNSYTIATALEGALEGARLIEKDLSKCKAAVVGASGSIGSVCARILARQVASINLVARNARKLKALAEIIEQESRRKVRIFDSVPEGISQADIIITATSSTGGIIRSGDLKPGAVVCDVALPHDVCREVAKERPDVLVIEGGLVEVPGNVDLNYDFGYPPGIALACMSETMILALEGMFVDYSLGRGIKIEQVEGISALAAKHGFKLAGLRSFDRMVTPDRLEEVKALSRAGSDLKVGRGG
jgi:predicted amino acid dehydrogenase